MPSSRSRGREREQGPGIETTPPRYPDTPPPILPSGDYSYTVEIVMKMQHSMGELTEAVKGLKERQAEQAKKLDRISHQMYAAIVVLTLVGGIFWYFANSINSLITQLISNSAQQQQQQASPQPTALPKKTS